MKRFARKAVLAGLAGLTAMVTLAACSSDKVKRADGSGGTHRAWRWSR